MGNSETDATTHESCSGIGIFLCIFCWQLGCRESMSFELQWLVFYLTCFVSVSFKWQLFDGTSGVIRIGTFGTYCRLCRCFLQLQSSSPLFLSFPITVRSCHHISGGSFLPRFRELHARSVNQISMSVITYPSADRSLLKVLSNPWRKFMVQRTCHGNMYGVLMAGGSSW